MTGGGGSVWISREVGCVGSWKGMMESLRYMSAGNSQTLIGTGKGCISYDSFYTNRALLTAPD